jgi:hypothetical protein
VVLLVRMNDATADYGLESCPSVATRVPITLTVLALALLGPVPAARGHGDVPLVDRCTPPFEPTSGSVSQSPNVEYLGSLPGEAGGLDAGGRLVGHYFYVTGSSHFSIYDVADPLHPKQVSRVDFPCRFENEDVAVDGNILLFSDFGTTASLYVYDVRDKAHPSLLAELPNAGRHTMTCIRGCDFAYGTYRTVSPDGALRTGEVVDLRDPAHPKVIGDWTDNGVLPSRNTHDVSELADGRVIAASAPIELLDASRDVVRPRVLARSDTPDDKRYHTVEWPRGGRDRFLLASFETNATPRCEAGSGDFSTFDTNGWRETGTLRRVDSYFLSNMFDSSGNPLLNVLGCSPHYFLPRPSFHDGGVVALGAYDNGMRLLRIDGTGKIAEIGHFQPPGAETSAAYWITCDIVYTVDYSRGIDILRVNDPASACPNPDAPRGELTGG